MEQNGKKLTILTTGDNPLASTGYGTVWNNLLKRWIKLKPDWKFYHAGWQNFDRPHKTAMVYVALPRGKSDYCYDKITYYLVKYKPDIFISLSDVGYQSGYIKEVSEAKKKGWSGIWICYTPVDTEGWCVTWDSDLSFCDINVAMSEFGGKQMKKHKVHNVHVIPHGVELEDFKPIKDREELKDKFGVRGKFVIGFVGKNQRRKMIERLLLGFARFAKDKEDVSLVLHTDIEPLDKGIHLHLISDLFEITPKILMTKKGLDSVARQTIDENTMNEIYNVMDVFGYATGGEGFGLPGIECQASGVPLLMTDYTTAQELCREKNRIPVLMDCHGRKCIDRGYNGVYFAYPDDIKMAELFEKYYKMWKTEKELFEKERKDAVEFAQKYNWDGIAVQWINLFEHEVA